MSVPRPLRRPADAANDHAVTIPRTPESTLSVWIRPRAVRETRGELEAASSRARIRLTRQAVKFDCDSAAVAEVSRDEDILHAGDLLDVW
jgi:hypothetical protein